MAEGWVDIDGGRLWYERGGEGFPVVLIHPGLWDSRIWGEQFQEFSRHHDTIRYDLRGSGRSDPPRGRYSDLRDLRTLLDALGVDRFAVVGCGSGGSLAIDAALAFPGSVDAIVAVAPGLSGYEWKDPGLDALAEQVGVAVRAGDLRGAMEIELAVWAPLSAADAQVHEIAMDNTAVLVAEEPLADPPPPAVWRLDDIEAATLVVVGDQDLAEVHAIADLIATSIPGAQKRVIAEADQLVNVGKPEKFNRLALDFLSFRG